MNKSLILALAASLTTLPVLAACSDEPEGTNSTNVSSNTVVVHDPDQPKTNKE